MVRTRFAPSPTGYLHIGGVRTALFNWLFARRHGGQFMLRIDDTDAERNVEAALAPILHGFRWLGIDWDEGPEVGGPYAPYYQSQRLAGYQAAAKKLLDTGLAYRDYATTDEIQAEREAAQAEKRPFLYSRRWMAETPQQAARFEAEGRQAVVRLKMPREGTLVINDHDPRASRVRVGPRAGSCHPAGRRHVPVSPGQRGRRFRFCRSRTSSGPKSICRTRRGRFSSPSRWAIRCPSTPICRSWPSRAARTSSASASSTSI